MKYNVAFVGPLPQKGSDNKYLPLPKENVEFMQQVMAKVDPSNYGFIFHGLDATGEVADQWAHDNRVRVRQFPAYWFDPSKPQYRDKQAGFKRNEAMIRDLKDSAFNKADVTTVLVAFVDKPLDEDHIVKPVVDFAKKQGIKFVQVLELPVSATTEANPTEAVTAPFGN